MAVDKYNLTVANCKGAWVRENPAAWQRGPVLQESATVRASKPKFFSDAHAASTSTETPSQSPKICFAPDLKRYSAVSFENTRQKLNTWRSYLKNYRFPNKRLAIGLRSHDS